MGPLRDIVWIATGDATCLLDVVEILCTAITLRNGPLGPFDKDVMHLFGREFQVLAPRPHTRRDVSKQGVHKPWYVVLDVGGLQTGA
jgi:hypothetical protein